MTTKPSRNQLEQLDKPALIDRILSAQRPYRATGGAMAPAGMEPERCYGARLQGLIAYLKHLQHCAYDRLEHLLPDVVGRSIIVCTASAKRRLRAAPPSAPKWQPRP